MNLQPRRLAAELPPSATPPEELEALEPAPEVLLDPPPELLDDPPDELPAPVPELLLDVAPDELLDPLLELLDAAPEEPLEPTPELLAPELEAVLAPPSVIAFELALPPPPHAHARGTATNQRTLRIGGWRMGPLRGTRPVDMDERKNSGLTSSSDDRAPFRFK